MTALLVLHVAVGAAILCSTRHLGRLAWGIGAVPMVASVAYGAVRSPQILDGDPVTEHHGWVTGLDLTIDLRLDGFGLLMLAIVSGIGVVVMAYASRYFSPTPAAARVAGLLVLFSGSMLGLVLADHLLVLFVCWELTSITSWQLIGTRSTDAAARSAALHALLVTSAGGLALLAGLITIGQEAGTFLLSDIVTAPPTGGHVGVGLGLILVGIMTKSAQFPTHAWLPGAMVAPTPISAYLHSATMVKAGIYLAARLAPAFAATGHWRTAVTVVGLTTMILGGLRALRQNDLKLLLAMGTTSQLGFLLVLVGVGHPEATLAGVTLLLAHALFKGALFLVVGIVDHEAGTRDRRELAGFGPGWGLVKAVTVVSAASMAGLPPLLGFIAKESAYEAFTHGGPWDTVTLAGLVAGSVLTFAYSYRFAVTIVGRPAGGATSPHRPPASFAAPAAALAGLTLLGGPAARLLDPLVGQAATDLDDHVHGAHLALWHGLGAPLYLSVATVLLGIGLVVLAGPVARVQTALAPQYDGEDAFAAAIRALYAISRHMTSVVQSGSLPIYTAVILLTAVAVPGAIMIGQGSWPGWPELAASPLQVVVAAVIIGAAVSACRARRRFSAVLLLGGIGYGMGLLFVLQGAPDLALTQFSVETLSITVFMLVLRKLPYGFKPQPGRRMWALRVAVSGAVAAGVFGFALVNTADTPARVADGAGEGPPGDAGAEAGAEETVADRIIEVAEPEGDGTNVVNVVLVDIRGLDTMGEISVLAAAGLGIVALARAGRGTSRDATGGNGGKAPTGGDTPDSGIDGGGTAAAGPGPDDPGGATATSRPEEVAT